MILLGAIAVGVVAALLLFQYIQGIENRAFENAKRVDVYIAKGAIKRSTPGQTAVDSGDIALTQIPQEFRAGTAINTTEEISQKVALFDISPGTTIVQGMFVDPVQTQITFRQRLKDPDHVAISISTDIVRQVAGLLVPTDEVNIMVFDQPDTVTDEEVEAASTSTSEGGNDGETAPTNPRSLRVLNSRARMLYQKVQIIAVGQTAKLEPGETTDPNKTTSAGAATGALTLSVPPDASLWIASAMNSGGMYLALNPDNYQAKPVDQIPLVIDKLPGEKADVLTPDGPNPPAAP